MLLIYLINLIKEDIVQIMRMLESHRCRFQQLF